MDWLRQKVYATKYKDEAVVAASRFGGIFTVLSDEMLENSGGVYGCILTEEFQAILTRAEDRETRNKM